MAHTVFFSWQSDTPEVVGKHFLEGILREICSEISADTELQEAIRGDITLDQDTQGEPGQPPIFQVILEKIDRAGVFVGDVTFVATRTRTGGLSPNPNVLIEHGYALSALKYKRVINVMNVAYGSPKEHELPFDMRHAKWPILYDLPENADTETFANVRSQLRKELTGAIKASLGMLPKGGASNSAKGLVLQPPEVIERFTKSAGVIGYKDELPFLHTGTPIKIHPTGGPMMWLRVMPQVDSGKKVPIVELRKILKGGSAGIHPETLIYRAGGYDFVRAVDGVGKYYANGSKKNEQSVTNVGSVVFIFDTGEIFSMDTFLLTFSERIIPQVEEFYLKAFTNYVEVLKAAGLGSQFKWTAGINGIEGRRLQMPAPPPGKAYFNEAGDLCLKSEVTYEGTFDAKSGKAVDALRPFFELLYDACAMERPTHLP